MQRVYLEMLEVMDEAFRDYEAALPKPVRVQYGRGWVYRFKDHDIHQAVLLKLALVQSTLRAALVLLKTGYVTQQAMLQRVIDEANEDILFLAYAATNDVITPLHQSYLAAFWDEEFGDPNDVAGTHKSRDMVPRKKIRGYLSRIQGQTIDPSHAAQVTKAISKTYSGYIHGASTHIMETYGGMPPHFHTRGMLDTPRVEEYTNDLWNYMYRGFLSHVVAAKLYGSKELVDWLNAHKERFETTAGKRFEDGTG